jgi:hypothetical protein
VEPTHDALAVEPQPTVKPAPAASGARAGALQRSIGNRGVVALLRETDPRLTYTKADKSATTFTDEVRCGANSVAERRQTTRDVYNRIWRAIRGVGDGTATYGDLSLIAHYAKVAMSEKADSSKPGHEVAVGTQLLRSGDANFWTLFETADGRWKASYIFIRPNF